MIVTASKIPVPDPIAPVCVMYMCYLCVLCMCVMYLCYVCVLCICVMYIGECVLGNKH